MENKRIMSIAKNVRDFLYGFDCEKSVETIAKEIADDPISVLESVMELAKQDWLDSWS